MKKVISTVILLIVLATTAYANSLDPAYHGKALSEWLVLDPLNTAEASDAIRQIGTNGIQTLLDMVSITTRTRPSVLAELKSADIKQEFSYDDANLNDLRDLAVTGFSVLGTNAESAVPQLTSLFYQKDAEPRFQVIAALNAVGPRGIAVLTNALHSPDGAIRNNVMYVMKHEPWITSWLIEELKDPVPINRGNAAMSLTGKDPQLAIPALMPLLDETSYPPLNSAVMALGSYGAAAKSAAPKLFSIYTNIMFNPDRRYAFDLGVTFMDAFKSIDPDTTAKAEAFLVNDCPLGVAGMGWTEVALPNGLVLIAGGNIRTTIPDVTNHIMSRAELFDPKTGKRTETGSMNVGRCQAAAILLPNGKVLVAGGNQLTARGDALTSAEIYDPKTGKWEKTGSMNSPHLYENPMINSDGKVQVGDEVYNPTIGTWTVAEKAHKT